MDWLEYQEYKQTIKQVLLYLATPEYDAFWSYNGIAKLQPIMLKIILVPRWYRDKELACNIGDVGSIPGLERPPGEGNGNPLQYSCLKNPMDRGAWWARVVGLQSQTFTCTQYFSINPKLDRASRLLWYLLNFTNFINFQGTQFVWPSSWKVISQHQKYTFCS